MENEQVYTAGVGAKTFSDNANDEDTKIRHAYLMIASTLFCHQIIRHEADIRSIICAYSQLKQTPCHGDSGMYVFEFPRVVCSIKNLVFQAVL